MKRIVASALLFFASLSSAFADPYWQPHWNGVDGKLTANAQVLGAGSAMVMGDSLTEGFWWNQFNGCYVTNAGYGGISAKELSERVHIPLNTLLPGSVILMIGTNSANNSLTPTERAMFSTHHLSIVDAIIAKGAMPILVSIPPIGKDNTLFSQSVINDFNTHILANATSRGLQFINLNFVLMDLNPSSPTYGYALPGYTVADHLHLAQPAYIAMYYAYQAAHLVMKNLSGHC